MNTVQKAIDDFQRKSGKTLQEIADEIGVSRVTLNKWKVRGFVSEDFVMKFSTVTGVPPWTINKLAKELGKAFATA